MSLNEPIGLISSLLLNEPRLIKKVFFENIRHYISPGLDIFWCFFERNGSLRLTTILSVLKNGLIKRLTTILSKIDRG